APTELLVGGGLYMPLPEDLSAVRHKLVNDSASFLDIVGNRQFRRLFGRVDGEQLSRVPRGFSAGHPAADYLKFKQFLVSRTFPAAVATTPVFYETVVKTFRAMLPFVRFLNEPILQARRIRERQDELFGSFHRKPARHGAERRMTSR